MSELEQVSPEAWRRAQAHGYANIWDGHRYMLRLDPETGATVWMPVKVTYPLIPRDRREQ
jgi:hypothetical protein